MQFYRFLFLFTFHHSFIFIVIASSTNIYDYFNNNNSSFNIDFHQCDTNTTIFNDIKNVNHTIFNNLIDSCNISCCISKNSNKTNSSNICQITVESSTGICLGRLCYSGTCSNFTLLANKTHNFNIKNKTTLINELHSSFSYIPWTSLVNSTKTKWSSWINNPTLTIRQIILVVLFIINISLTFIALVIVFKSIRHANIISNDRSYRYTLL